MALILDRAARSRSVDGRLQRMVGTHTDIHPHKLLEQQLREQQAQLEEAQRIASMGSWSWTAAATACGFSEDFARQLSLPGKPCSMCEPGTPTSAWRVAAHCARPGGACRRGRRAAAFRIGTGQAAAATRAGVGATVFDGDGTLLRLVGQVQNVTEQRQTDALIRWRTELLNRVSALGRIGGCEIEVDTRGA